MKEKCKKHLNTFQWMLEQEKKEAEEVNADAKDPEVRAKAKQLKRGVKEVRAVCAGSDGRVGVWTHTLAPTQPMALTRAPTGAMRSTGRISH